MSGVRLFGYGLAVGIVAVSVMSVEAGWIHRAGPASEAPAAETATEARPVAYAQAYEPGTLALLGSGVFGLVGMAKRRRKRQELL